MCSRATEGWRISLEDGWLIVTRNGGRIETLVTSQNEFGKLLKEYFGIIFPKEMT
jgi:hypothetical protein